MPTDTLSVTFAALADPTRRAILARLASGTCSVTELAAPFEMSLPAVSKHLRVLERAGLVARGREAQYRPCRLEATPLKDVADWAERYRHLWEGRLDRLDSYLQALQAKARRAAPRRAQRREQQTHAPESLPAAARESAAASPAKETRHARQPRRRS